MTLVQYNLSMYLPWFRMKLRMFYAAMFPSFILQTAKNFILPWCKVILYYALRPLLPCTRGMIFWTSIATAYISLLYIEYETLFKYKPPTYSKREYRNTLPMVMFNTPLKPSHPLPKHYCVLSAVALLPTFTGYLAKLGKTFGGFITSMNQIGLNSIYFIELNCAASNRILKTEVLHKRKCGQINTQKIVKSVIMIILYLKLWCISASQPRNKINNKEYFHHDDWKISEDLNSISWTDNTIDEEDLPDKAWNWNSTLSDQKKLPIHQTSCALKQI